MLQMFPAGNLVLIYASTSWKFWFSLILPGNIVEYNTIAVAPQNPRARPLV
jgi:hypothetical protein